MKREFIFFINIFFITIFFGCEHNKESIINTVKLSETEFNVSANEQILHVKVEISDNMGWNFMIADINGENFDFEDIIKKQNENKFYTELEYKWINLKRIGTDSLEIRLKANSDKKDRSFLISVHSTNFGKYIKVLQKK